MTSLLVTLGVLLAIIASPTAHAGSKKTSDQPKSTFANGPSDGGRLIITRSPVIGDNISISIYIDGQVAGTLARYQTFDRYLAPGRHEIVARPGRLAGTWRGTIDVSLGKTIKYVASYATDHVVLGPAKGWSSY